MKDHYALLLSTLILAVLIFVAGFIILSSKHSDDATGMISRPIPVFAQAEFGSADLKDQVTLVNFFASWCAPCEAEHATLMRLKTDHGVRIYGISYKDGDSSRQDYLQRLGNPYIAVTSDKDGTLGDLWQTTGVPETFIIDAAGMIRFHQAAPLTDTQIQTVILPIIRQLQSQHSEISP